MKYLPLALMLIFSKFTLAQSSSAVTVIDFVSILPGKQPETLYFYENNWKMYRDIALKKGFITSYQLLMTNADGAAGFHLMLMTTYADSLQYRQSEERFREIINTTTPNGPKLLNALKPNEFRKNLYFREAQTLFEAHQ